MNSSDLQRFPLQYQTKQQEESADAEAFTFPEDGQMIRKKSEPHYVTYWNETTTKNTWLLKIEIPQRQIRKLQTEENSDSGGKMMTHTELEDPGGHGSSS